MIRNFTALLAVGLTLAACSAGRDKSIDSALSTDLSLAAQQRGADLDTLSPTEANFAQPAAAPVARRAAPSSSASRTTRRAASSSSQSASSAGRSSGSATGTVARQPRTVTVKHGKRDAAIGAAAGAVLGATTSRNKVKGGVIGAAVGGILGGVLGNNVDKQTKTVP